MPQRLLPHPVHVLKKLPTPHNRGQCLPCTIGKTTRSPSPRQAQHTGQPPAAPLDIVATDTTGPINTNDEQANRYLRLLVDVYTGLTRGQPIKTKGQATHAISSHVKVLQVLLGTALKRQHSDGAHERQTPALKKLLSEQGTRQTTRPHTTT